MAKINQLPEEVIALIAAGEVIERPSYAVKELVENSIDAGADSILVSIEDSGLRKIVVSDNGEGMDREDLEIAYMPHTTSKISTEDHLSHIATLGFRGEALSSIAAISQMSIKSRTQNSASGILLENKKGSLLQIKPIGSPVGTTVTINNLFFPVPARKKFLKSSQTEFRHISDIVSSFAMSYPTIHFKFSHNEKNIFDLPNNQSLLERARSILGEGVAANFLPIIYEEGYIKIEGFVSNPQYASKQNQKQYIFVNKRLVQDKMISLAVKESFGTLLPQSATPIFILSITLPFEMVDVNVHPRKEQVSFLNARILFDNIKLAVIQALTENNLTFNLSGFAENRSGKKGETSSLSADILKSTVLPWNRKEVEGLTGEDEIIQIHSTYLLTSTKNGLVLIDQHGAHERILYEKFVSEFENQKSKKESYHLEKPITIELSLNDAQVLKEYKDIFAQMEFGIEHFQANTYLVRFIPVVFKGRNISKIINDMISDLASHEGIQSIDVATKRMLAFLSCRAAVKAGDVLSVAKQRAIIKDLQKAKNNTTCPHGRPTKQILPLGEINKWFRRR